jgi:hypothetical protein
VEELNPKEMDKAKCIHYCSMSHVFIRENGVGILDNVFFSAEAWFYLSSYIYKSSKNFPYILKKKLEYSTLSINIMSWDSISLRIQLMGTYSGIS